jgi:hypothetical protein
MRPTLRPLPGDPRKGKLTTGRLTCAPTRQHFGRFDDGRAGLRRQLSPVADIPCYTLWTAMGQELPHAALQAKHKGDPFPWNHRRDRLRWSA